MMKRLGLLVVVVLLLCGVAAPASLAAQQKRIVVWHHTYPPAIEYLKELAKEYEGTHPDVSIEVVEYPHGDYEVKLLSAFASGTSPDIINLLDYKFPEYISKGLLAEINPKSFGAANIKELEDMYMPRALEGLSYNGKVYGVPLEFNTMSLFVNTKHFKEIGIDITDPKNWPRTWDELFEVAQKLTKRNSKGEIVREGFDFVWGIDPFWYAQQYWGILRQFGANVLSPDGKTCVINSPEAVEAFNIWRDVVYKYKTGGPAVSTINPVNALQDFSDGRQSICSAGIWAPPSFTYNPDVYNNLAALPFPQKDPKNPQTVLYAYALAVSSRSKVQSEAWSFINFVTSHSDEWLKRSGYITGRKGCLDSAYAKQAPFVQVFKNDLAYGSYVFRHPRWTEIGKAIQNAIERIGMQGMDTKQSLDICKREIDKILAETK